MIKRAQHGKRQGGTRPGESPDENLETLAGTRQHQAETGPAKRQGTEPAAADQRRASEMSEATVTVRINDKDSHEFFISDFEMNEEPETTCYDISQAIAQDLNTRSWDAVVKIRIQGENASSPRMRFDFINGGRGWEARSTFESWLMQSLSLITEHDCKHGPISSDKNRRDASSYLSKHGVAH